MFGYRFDPHFYQKWQLKHFAALVLILVVIALEVLGGRTFFSTVLEISFIITIVKTFFELFFIKEKS